MAKTRDFSEVVRRKIAADPDLEAAVDQESFNAHVAMLIYEARTAAGLTQQQLAKRIGTHQPVIARLEDADYDSHSLAMLKKIAQALNRRLGVEFYSISEPIREAACEFTLNMDSPWEEVEPWKPRVCTSDGSNT